MSTLLTGCELVDVKRVSFIPVSWMSKIPPLLTVSEFPVQRDNVHSCSIRAGYTALTDFWTPKGPL